MTEQDALKKTLQAEKRKRQKEEAMVEQKEAILRKYASAMNAKREKQTTDSIDTQKIEKVRPISDISYVSSISGSFISFGPNVQLPSCFERRESAVEKRFAFFFFQLFLFSFLIFCFQRFIKYEMLRS